MRVRVWMWESQVDALASLVIFCHPECLVKPAGSLEGWSVKFLTGDLL